METCTQWGWRNSFVIRFYFNSRHTNWTKNRVRCVAFQFVCAPFNSHPPLAPHPIPRPAPPHPSSSNKALWIFSSITRRLVAAFHHRQRDKYSIRAAGILHNASWLVHREPFLFIYYEQLPGHQSQTDYTGRQAVRIAANRHVYIKIKTKKNNIIGTIAGHQGNSGFYDDVLFCNIYRLVMKYLSVRW